MDVRTLCLGILSMGDASGYEIKKRLEGPFRHFYDASFGSIYPALARLQQDALVNCTLEAQESRPDRKVYSLTPLGRLTLVKELTAEPGPDRIRSEFLATMMFADLLPPRTVAQIIDARIAEHQETLGYLRRLGEGSLDHGQAFVLGYGIALYEAKLKYLEENRHLVEGDALLAQVRAERTRASAAD